MNSSDVARIERDLEVALPTDLREFLVAERDETDPDDVEIMDDADAIVEMTREFRSGFVGLPKWPRTWVYLGDESDACPYYVDCSTGAMCRLHKGDLRQRPLNSYESFSAFRDRVRADRKSDIEADKEPLTWKDTVRFYTPAAIGLFLFFVVLPLCAFGISTLFKWLFK